MSHFTVLIIGDEPEDQLVPYDESIEVAEYQRDLVSPEDKESFLNVYQNYDPTRTYAEISQHEANVNKTLSFDELYEKYGDDWNSNSWRKNSDNEWAEMSTYNPKSKWDWFQLGGRWSGFFKKKKGVKGKVGEPGVFKNEAPRGYCDQARKKDIDFEGMRVAEAKDSAKQYKKVRKIFGGKIPKVEFKWNTIIDDTEGQFSKMTIDEKRNFYHNQPACQETTLHQEELGYGFNIELYDCTLEEFVQKGRDNACSTFAVVKNGEWFEKGQMGWWACVSNEKDNWNEEFNKLIDEASDDTLFSLYDCHI